MILNVSGRTDIVAFYSEWFINRYKEGYVDVRNPIYPKNISRIYFDDVEAIVFCTKNPLPIIDKINLIDKPILFHITITGYNKDIEPNVISKKLIIEGVKKISHILGKDRVVVRYDPILINDKYTVDYHIKAFSKLCSELNGYISKIIVSFIDNYKNVRNNMSVLKLKNIANNDYQKIGLNFSRIAKEYGVTVQTCSEEFNLCEYGFIKGDCVSLNDAYRLTGKTNFKKWKSRNNKYCNCVNMVDIGEYNTCPHLCKYCYANYEEKLVKDNCLKHDVNSSLLIGHIMEDDVVKVRKNS